MPYCNPNRNGHRYLQFSCAHPRRPAPVCAAPSGKIPEGACLCLFAPMGAGKTTFIQSLCQCLGVKDRVVSPTFSLVNEYKSDFGPIYHFDFYRLKNAEEALDIGTDEYLESGHYCFMEWSEIAESIFPERFVRVEIEPDANGTRHIHAYLVK